MGLEKHSGLGFFSFSLLRDDPSFWTLLPCGHVVHGRIAAAPLKCIIPRSARDSDVFLILCFSLSPLVMIDSISVYPIAPRKQVHYAAVFKDWTL